MQSMTVFLKITLTFILFIGVYQSNTFADIVYLKDGSEVKGIIVEQYSDRIVISTEYGETEIESAEIKRINYDLPEQNLVALADRYRQMANYSRAYYYYEKAKEENPKCQEAIDGLNYLEGYRFRKNLGKKIDDIRWQRDVESFSDQGIKKPETSQEKLKTVLGMELSEFGKDIKVLKVYSRLPAAKAGIKKGDTLSAVWGKLTGYMSCPEVARLLTDTPQAEVCVKIDRDIKVTPGIIKPSQLDLRFYGLFLTHIKKKDKAHRAGLREDDLIVAIDGKSTRYAPRKQVIEMLKKAPRTLTLRREITIWRTKR